MPTEQKVTTNNPILKKTYIKKLDFVQADAQPIRDQKGNKIEDQDGKKVYS